MFDLWQNYKLEPGRLANLTSEQEAALKQIWVCLLVSTEAVPNSSLEDYAVAIFESEDGVSVKTMGKTLFGKKKEKVVALESLVQPLREAQVRFVNSLSEFKIQGGREIAKQVALLCRRDHPDETLLRFLRARKWNLQDSLQMLAETLRFRCVELDVHAILRHGERRMVIDKQTKLEIQYTSKKSYMYGTDNHGRPLVLCFPVNHDPNAQDLKDVQEFTIYLIETARLCLHSPVATAAILFDLSEFSMNNMDMSATRFMIKCFQNHYPESLGFVLIHKAPWVFQGVWNVIKNLLDPVVAAKIIFSQTTDDIAKHIPRNFIPKHLGGDSEYEYKYVAPTEEELKDPRLDDEAEREVKTNQVVDAFFHLQSAVHDWVLLSDKLGPKNEAIDRFKQCILDTEPWLRATSHYERTGVQQLYA